MVARFKIQKEDISSHDINREMVETLLGKQPPWYKKRDSDDDDQYFAVCPYCDNPIQLKGLYRRQANSPKPYGSHTGKPIDGFPHFDMDDLTSCPYILKKRRFKKEERRKMGDVANRLIDRAVNEFDRIVYVLRDDFGFPFSLPFAEKMLDHWFSAKGYLYMGAHLRNLPWMIAYFGPAHSLYGQFIASNTELATAISQQVSGTKITDKGQLTKDGTAWFKLHLQCLHHRIKKGSHEGLLQEQLTLRVQDFTKTNLPGKAPTIYSKTIAFEPERFERLLLTSPEGGKTTRNQALLDIANRTAEKWKI